MHGACPSWPECHQLPSLTRDRLSKGLHCSGQGVCTIGEIQNYSSKPVHILHRHFALYMPMLSLDFAWGLQYAFGSCH